LTPSTPRPSRTTATIVARKGVSAGLIGALLAAGCAQQPGTTAPVDTRKIGQPGTPTEGVTKYVEGVRAYRSGDQEQAISALEDATRANPKLTMARALLGDLYKERGDYTKAADQYKAATELDPYTGRNFYKLGVAYHLLQQLQDAVNAYLRAMKLDPKDWESHMNVGLVYLALGNKSQAVSYLSQATIINPGAGVAFGNLAIALDAQGRYAEAEAAYKRALELDPDDTASLGNLGKNLMRQNKPEQALIVLRKLADLTESASARKLYGDALVLGKQHDAAIRLYDGILREDGKYYPALNGKGAALIGKYEQGLRIDARPRQAAVQAWKQSLALNPQQPKVQEMVRQWEQ
jgi:tetratricopeptide (TPR) repeat protein